MTTLLDNLLHHKIIAILRGLHPSQAKQTGEAIIDSGIAFMEVTMNTVGAEKMIYQWREQFDGQAWVGAGTVIDLEHAIKAKEAGAQFMISPNLDLEVIQFGQEQGIDVWPGVMTPTEMIQAIKAGVNAVKLFPMASLGLQYLKEIRGPINDFPIIATGGVNIDNFDQYFASGANAVGMGQKLVNLDLVQQGDFEAVRKQISLFTKKVAQMNQNTP